MIHVGVNGYGTIGKRVADAVRLQPDMKLVGVAKTRPNYEAEAAVRKGYRLYAAIPERSSRFTDVGIDLHGEIDDLVIESDVIVDATPAGVGADNAALYAAHETPAIPQGGEAASAVETSFVAQANYADAVGADLVRVVSCNTTGLSRLLAPLAQAYGVEKAHVTLIRRGGDPGQLDRGPINDILPDPITVPSHHGPDVQTILPELDISTVGVKVPATLMHLHSVNLTLAETPTTESVCDLLSSQPRLFMVPESMKIEGTAHLKEYAADAGRPRGDLWENCLWMESVSTAGNDVSLFQSIHQEANVVPENIDAIRAIDGRTTAEASIQLTNERLGITANRLLPRPTQHVSTQPADD